jgi:hypothetical protein
MEGLYTQAGEPLSSNTLEKSELRGAMVTWLPATDHVRKFRAVGETNLAGS